MIRIHSHHIVAPALMAMTMGCAFTKPIHVIDVSENLAKWHGPTSSEAAHKHASINVRVVGTPTMGILLYAPGAPQPPPISLEPNGHEEEQLQSILEKDARATGAVLVKGGGKAVQTVLRRELERYYATVHVELQPVPPPQDEIAVNLNGLAIVPGFYSRTTTFTATALLPNGSPLSVMATPHPANAAGHLGWALPLSLATFPWGISFIGPIFGAIYTGMEGDKAFEAIDIASASLATKLSETAAM